MKSKVRLIEKNTGQVLFECSVDDTDLAYEKAAEFESMGLDIKLDMPTVNQTLADSLGVTGESRDSYEESLAEEMEHHEGSCCFDESGEKIIH